MLKTNISCSLFQVTSLLVPINVSIHHFEHTTCRVVVEVCKAVQNLGDITMAEKLVNTWIKA